LLRDNRAWINQFTLHRKSMACSIRTMCRINSVVMDWATVATHLAKECEMVLFLTVVVTISFVISGGGAEIAKFTGQDKIV